MFFFPPSNHQSVNLHQIFFFLYVLLSSIKPPVSLPLTILLDLFIVFLDAFYMFDIFLSSIKPLVNHPFTSSSCLFHYCPCFQIFPVFKFCAPLLLLHLKSDDFFFYEVYAAALHKSCQNYSAETFKTHFNHLLRWPICQSIMYRHFKVMKIQYQPPQN